MQKKSAVIKFIEEEREKGTGEKQIRHKLLDAGWHMDIIHHAMNGKRGPDHKPLTRPSTSSSLPVTKEAAYLVTGGITFAVLALLAVFI